MPANLYHFIIDNGAYESTGSQPTISAGVNLAQIAKAAGYRFAEYALDKASLHKCLDEMLETTGPGLVIVKSARGVAAQAGRAPAPPREYIETFMHNLTNNTGAGEAAAAAFRTLTAYLEGTGGKGKVLILTYKAALANRDIHSLMEQIKRMYRAVVIAAFSTPLLTVDDLVGLEAEIKTGFRPTLIITIGGGNLIDAGKCLKFLYATGTTAAALPANSGKQHRVSDLAYNPLHVAIPTTNGSGSAATTFAVFHHQKQRYSLDFPFLLPDRCFSFPFLLHTLPRDMTVANILDALCHCVESLWSVKATPQSMEYAREALECIHALLPGFYAGEPAPGVEVLEQMLAASNLAGKAINISQTTLVHGLAYPLTAAYGTAHGLACFLNLPVVWEYNTHNIHNAAARAPQLAAAVDTVCTLFAQDEQCMAGCFRDVLQRLGCSSCLEDYFPASAIETIIHSAVNSGGCTQNNPLAVDSALLRAAYSRYYTLPGQGSL